MSLEPPGPAVAATTRRPPTGVVAVAAPIDKAFLLFTDGIGSWRAPEHHIVQGELL